VELLRGQSLRPRTLRWVTNSTCKGERENGKGRGFSVGSAKRRPERTKSPREQGSHLGLNIQGAEIRLFSWEEVAGAPGEGRKVFTGSARAEREGGNAFSDHEKGETLCRAKPKSVGS
jgi:hypothetical protein